jgi:glucose/arabinose dehydrogenase
MKTEKIYFIIALMLIVVVAGCATAPLKASGDAASKEAETTVVETTTSTSQPTAPAVPAAVSYEITAETTSKLDAVFRLGDTMAVSEGSRKMSFGDSYVFAVGIGNPNIPSENFQLKAELKKTYDTSMNSMLSNLSYANTWLESNSYEIKNLKRGEQIAVPFIVEIKNLVDGTKPKLGTYEFKLTVLRQENFEDFRKEYASKTITIQVV